MKAFESWCGNLLDRKFSKSFSFP